MVGQTVSHYKVIEKLGGGGMGVVYKAEDTKLHRTIALKFLPPELTRDEEAKQRFINEAQAASSLDHNNICTIHEVDETDDGQIFICMNFYDGETLKKKIERGPIKTDEAIDIIIQIANGLQKAHEKGIIHRDIKPANIFITNDGVVKILDFGLAKLSGQTMMTKMGETVGTIAYMSPEQTRGELVDQRTDIWSLGVVLYEMLTRNLPFKGEYEQATIYSILNSDFKSIKVYRDDIPNELEEIITKALAKNLEFRYEEISELKNDLETFEKGKKIIPHKKKVNKFIIYLSSLSVLIIAFLLVVFFQKETIPFAKRDWILIADFENHTEEKVFDKSLYTAFTLSIDQSRYVNVISRRRMMENLKIMEKSDLNFIDEETIREMAIREGINIYLLPGISKVGNKYIITCKIHEAKYGEMLKSEILYAEEDDILDQLDKLSQNLREDLGESDLEISKQDKPLSKVTTSSLEALKEYSLGIEEHWKSNFKQARNNYENALKIDSNFISAKASLGNLLFEKFNREEGKKLLKEAIKSLDKVSEKEKYAILAFYAVNVEGNLEEGIKYTKIRTELYPDDATPHSNLGWYYQNTGRFRQAVSEYEAALKIDPHLMLTYSGIIWTYLEKLGETDSALAWVKKSFEYDDKNAWSYFYLGSIYVAMDSLINAEQAFRKALEIYPDFILNMYRLAHVYRLQEKYQEAIRILQKILSLNENDYSAHYDLGVNYKMLGNNKKAMEHFNKYREYAERLVKQNPKDAESYFCLSTVLARLENYKKSWELGKKVLKIDTTSYIHMAEIRSLHKKTSEALNYLQKAINNGYRNYVWLRLDPDLQNVNNDPKFKEIIAIQK
jgi:serine/threonine protein kinase/Tfp pilus assembly protein PilF